MDITKTFEHRCNNIECLLQYAGTELAVEYMSEVFRDIESALTNGIIEHSQSLKLHGRLMRCLAFFEKKDTDYGDY